MQSRQRRRANRSRRLADDQWIYYVCLATALLTGFVCQRIARGSVGRALIGVRDNETVIAALGVRDNETVIAALGVRVATLKTKVFALSAALASVAGVLYTYVVQFVGPDAFGLTLAIGFITMIVIGGLGSDVGVAFGALFVVYVPQLTSDVNQSAAGFAYGAALIGCMFVLPFGVIGLFRLLAGGESRRWVRP